MTFTGVDIDSTTNIVKWKVDNSWGEPVDNFIMTNDWFKEYVFEVIINKNTLTKIFWIFMQMNLASQHYYHLMIQWYHEYR